MSLKERKFFMLKDEGNERNSWSISFTIDPNDDTQVVIGLHWNDKTIPTHEFTMKRSDFEKVTKEIK